MIDVMEKNKAKKVKRILGVESETAISNQVARNASLQNRKV